MVAPVEKRWNLPPQRCAEELALARELRSSALLARLLWRRGARDAEAARQFLEPRLSQLHDPLLLPGIEAATRRVEEALRKREKIAIFGDYDVDGVSSTALLSEFFALIDYPVISRLPHRLEEGYGLRVAAVRELAARGASLIITVDNGSSSFDEIEAARELGVDVVVIDHHRPPARVPRAAALVNPWSEGSRYPFPDLAGVGVTFKFVWALSQRLSRQTKLSGEYRDFLLESLAFVALGTVSDVVPLLGENRVLTSFGLRALRASKRPGLHALVRAALKSPAEQLEARHIAFRIGPKLNAAGRLGTAQTALDLLLATDAGEARRLERHLESENGRRRQIENEILAQVRASIGTHHDVGRARALVVGGTGWHGGVIGIVAARLVEEFSRPALVVSIDGERGRGSARSVAGVHICDALARCAEHLETFGGHEMAAGLELAAESLADLRRALNEAISLPPDEMIPAVAVEDRVHLAELEPPLLEELDRLAPHGHGNPEPLLAVEDAGVVGRPRAMGADGSHLAFHVRQGDTVRRAVAFGRSDLHGVLSGRGARVSLLLAPQLSTWQGRREVELHVRDLRVNGS